MVGGTMGAEEAAGNIATAVFRKSQDIPKETIKQMVDSVPEPSRPAAGSSADGQLGQNIDVKA